MKSSSDGLNGSPDAGYSLICDGFKTVKQFETEPSLIAQLVNIHCTTLNIDAMNTLISRCGINRQNAEQLLFDLDKLDLKTGMGHARDGDTLMFRELFEKFMTGGNFNSYEKEMIMEMFKSYFPGYPKEEISIESIKFLLSGFFEIDKEILMGKLNFLLDVWPFLYQDYACFLKHEARVKALYSKPYWALEQEIQELKDEASNTPAQYLISPILFEPYTVVCNRTKVANVESEIDAAKLTLALHIYKNQTGAFPDKLEQLAPGILKEIPVDPISGKPFEYQKTDGKFKLSSVWLKEKTEQDRKRQEQNRREQKKRNRTIQK